MPKSAECVVSAGAHIQIEWFQTDDQSICFAIRHVPGSNTAIQRSDIGNNNALLSWNYSQQNEDDLRTISFRALRETNSNESDDEQHDKIGRLKQKIEREQAKKIEDIKQHAVEWTEKPISFFRICKPVSSEEWSIACLFDLDSKRDADRVPFHKINLANHFKQRIASDQTTKAACRRAIMLAKYTNYDNLSDVLRSIKDANAGLLLTIAPFMTRQDLKLISKKDPSRIDLTWVHSNLFEEARAFEELALRIFASMETVQAPKRTADTQPQAVPPEKRPRHSISSGPARVSTEMTLESRTSTSNSTGQNFDTFGMLDGQQRRAVGSGDTVSENLDIGASTYTSLVPLQRATVFDPERPVALNNSSIGRVEIVLQHIQRYIDGRMPRATDLLAGIVLGPEQEKKAFDHLRTMQDKLIYGVGIMVQKPTPQAWQLINEGFQMVDSVLLRESRSIIRLLLRIFGGEGWDRFPELRNSLLRHFASASIVRFGRSHPLSVILVHLQDEEVLNSALEEVFLVLLDTLNEKLDPADDEMRFLRLDLCFLLRQRRKYAAAERYGFRFLGEAERVYGRCHAVTRGLLLKIGDVYLHQKLQDQAIEMFNDVLRRSYDALGTDFDIVGVYAHRNLSRIYEELGDNATSQYHWDAVVGAAQRIWGVGTEKFVYFAAEAREAKFRHRGLNEVPFRY